MAEKCSNCGSALAERSKFCPSCGTPRAAASVVPSQVRVTDGGEALLDLFDGDRLVWARLADLHDVVVFRPDPAEILTAA